MIYNLYAIRDSRVNGYMSVMQDMSDNAAIRNFSFAVNQENSLYHSFAKDFSLVKLGTYDSDTGVIDALPMPELVIDGMNVLEV